MKSVFSILTVILLSLSSLWGMQSPTSKEEPLLIFLLRQQKRRLKKPGCQERAVQKPTQQERSDYRKRNSWSLLSFFTLRRPSRCFLSR